MELFGGLVSMKIQLFLTIRRIRSRSVRHPIAETFSSDRNLQMSKLGDTKSEHGFFCGVPEVLGVLTNVVFRRVF